jgi:alanine racemase
MSTEAYRCWAEIERAALRHNAKAVRDRLGGSTALLAVVKANAYGHGMVGVAQALQEDTRLFGVANLEEAVALRAVLSHPVVILGPALPQERAAIVEGGFIASVSTLDEAQDFNLLARNRSVPVCFVVDTGMGRMGTLAAEALEVFRKIAALPNLKMHSISTHLPVSNEDENYTREELAGFGELTQRFRREVPGDYKIHVLPSAGVLAYSDPVSDFVRAGIMLYGISPLPDFQNILRPVMTWKTRIGLIRDMPKGSSISYGRTFIAPRAMKVATLTAGYADGYPRHLSNRDAAVLVRGQRCPLLGRVTMDLMMVDVSAAGGMETGDEVVLMGRQADAEISCAELAERANTITWEITTRVGQRVRRVFV